MLAEVRDGRGMLLPFSGFETLKYWLSVLAQIALTPPPAEFQLIAKWLILAPPNLTGYVTSKLPFPFFCAVPPL